jgi:hypothetical protein
VLLLNDCENPALLAQTLFILRATLLLILRINNLFINYLFLKLHVELLILRFRKYASTARLAPAFRSPTWSTRPPQRSTIRDHPTERSKLITLHTPPKQCKHTTIRSCACSLNPARTIRAPSSQAYGPRDHSLLTHEHYSSQKTPASCNRRAKSPSLAITRSSNGT